MLVKKTEFRIICGDIKNFILEKHIVSSLKGRVTEVILRKAFRDVFHAAKKRDNW